MEVAWPWTVLAISLTIVALAVIWWGLGLLLRRGLYNWTYFARRAWCREAGRIFGRHFYVVTLVQPLLMVAAIGIATEFLWREKTLEGFVVALGVIGFVFIEGPRFTLPSIQAAFVTATDAFGDDFLTKRLHVRPSDQCLLRFRVTNLGINYLENCSVRFCFDDGFEVLSDETAYRDVDTGKTLTVLRHNRHQCAVFEPGANYMGVASGNHLDFAVCVKTPAQQGSHPVRVLVAAQPRWGEVEVRLTLSIDGETA